MTTVHESPQPADASGQGSAGVCGRRAGGSRHCAGGGGDVGFVLGRFRGVDGLGWISLFGCQTSGEETRTFGVQMAHPGTGGRLDSFNDC